MRLLRPIALLCLLAASDMAGAAEPTAEDLAQAKQLFTNGRTLFGEGRYEDAAAAWEQAYELSGRPLLLSNLANAYERAGDFDTALARLNRYRAFAPEAEQEQLEARIRNLEDRIDERRRAEEAAEAERSRAEAEAARKAAEAERLAEQARLEEERLAAERAALEAERAERKVSGLAVGSFVGGGVFVGLGVAGTVLAVDAERQLGSLCAPTDGGRYCLDGADGPRADASTGQLLAAGGYVLGLAGLVTGLVVVATSQAPEARPVPAADVWVAPARDGAVVGVSGAF